MDAAQGCPLWTPIREDSASSRPAHRSSPGTDKKGFSQRFCGYREVSLVWKKKGFLPKSTIPTVRHVGWKKMFGVYFFSANFLKVNGSMKKREPHQDSAAKHQTFGRKTWPGDAVDLRTGQWPTAHS